MLHVMSICWGARNPLLHLERRRKWKRQIRGSFVWPQHKNEWEKKGKSLFEFWRLKQKIFSLFPRSYNKDNIYVTSHTDFRSASKFSPDLLTRCFHKTNPLDFREEMSWPNTDDLLFVVFYHEKLVWRFNYYEYKESLNGYFRCLLQNRK